MALIQDIQNALPPSLIQNVLPPSLIQNVLPPSRENWEWLTWMFQFFPLFTVYQWSFDFYPQGKTSIQSRFNIPGKIGWITMEAPGFITLLYIMFTLPRQLGLESLGPTNWTMAGLFTIHYLYRSILSPLLNPSMAPIHVSVWLAALGFQLVNAICIGGWLAGYGPVTIYDWAGRVYEIQAGLCIWAIGFMGNIFHDDDLREIRRAAARVQKKRAQEKDEKGEKGEDDKSVQDVYMVPESALFRWILYPHYLFEWIEWAGFWIVGGLDCVPARNFLLNEISTMLPRAVQGRRWYIERFGRERIGSKKAVIPGLL
ncbi:MAG: hypothetical protein M1819_005037 [Sarea resinae]|nr:MAG: hypothetical protein M1819_005037 [Sarea resinae]